MQIETRQVRVPRHRRQHPRRVGIVPQTPHPRPRARAKPDPPLHRGAGEAGQRGGCVDQRIHLDPVGLPGIEPAAPEQALHPRGDPRQHAADPIIGRRWQGPELERSCLALEEDGRRGAACAFVALDVERLAKAGALLERLAGVVIGCKIGSQLFTAAGPVAQCPRPALDDRDAGHLPGGARRRPRTATPATAVRAGASYLVVGRPVIAAADPAAAARAIVEEIARAAA